MIPLFSTCFSYFSYQSLLLKYSLQTKWYCLFKLFKHTQLLILLSLNVKTTKESTLPNADKSQHCLQDDLVIIEDNEVSFPGRSLEPIQKTYARKRSSVTSSVVSTPRRHPAITPKKTRSKRPFLLNQQFNSMLFSHS